MEIPNSEKKNTQVAGRILKNFGFLAVGKLLGDVFVFVMFVAISRKFGQVGIGEYSFAMALTSLLMILADFGLTNQSIKKMSRDREGIFQYYAQVLVLRIFLITISIILLFIVSPFLALSERGYQVIILVGSFQILYSLLDGVGSIFIAKEKMQYKGAIEFSYKATSAILCIAIILFNGGLAQSLVALPTVVIFHIFIAHYLIIKKLGKLNIRVDLYRSVTILKDSVSYAGFLLLQQLALRIDIVLLGFLINSSAAGIYNVAYRFLFILLFLPYFGAMSIYPLASRLFNTSRDDLVKLYRTSINLTILMGLPIASGIWLIAPELIVVIFGENFTEAILILRILSVALFFSFINGIAGIFLTATDRQVDRTKNQALCALSYVIGNIILIPIYGMIGAAVAAIIAEALLTLLSFRKLKGYFGVPQIYKRLWIASAGSLTFCLPLEFYITIPLFLNIIVSTGIYIVVIYLSKDVRSNEFQLAYRLIKSKKISGADSTP